MKVHITRRQTKNMIGGVSFESDLRIAATDEEIDLLRKFKAQKEIIWSSDWMILGQKISMNVTIEDLLAGKKFKSRNLYEHVELEEALLSACGNMKLGINVMRNIDKEQIFEI